MTRVGTDETAATAATVGRQWPRRAMLAGSGAALLACAGCGSTSNPPPPPTTAADGSIAAVNAIPAGSGLIADAPSGKIILADANGKVVAHTAVCTHQGAIIDGSGTYPLHGSRFDPATGAVINGPAVSPLAVVAVTEKDGKVYPA